MDKLNADDIDDCSDAADVAENDEGDDDDDDDDFTVILQQADGNKGTTQQPKE